MLADFINGGGAKNEASAHVPFGKRTADVTHEFHNWDYLQAGPGEQWKPARGTHTTRFHKGFQRRNQAVIGQDAARKEFEEHRAVRTAEVANRRRKYLDSRDKKNGYNVITGRQFEGGAALPVHHRQRKHFDDGKVSEFLQREGDVLIRTSNSRFHRPVIVTTEKRTRRIKNEGLANTVKYSSLLGIGRNDLRSYGVADNFGKSLYPWNRPSTTAPASRGGATAAHSARPSVSAGGAGSVLSGTARSVLGSARSVASKPPRDPELHAGRGGSGMRGGDDVGNGGGGYDANASMRSARSHRSVASRQSQRSGASFRSAASRSFRAASARQQDVDFVRALPE